MYVLIGSKRLSSSILKMFSSRSRLALNLITKFTKQQSLVKSITTITNKTNIFSNVKPAILNSNLEIYRNKHKDSKKGKKTELTESEDEEEHESDDWSEGVVDKQTKMMTVKVNSLRADVILKAGLGIARNKIETMFYESKIRVNGRKLLKKSAMLSVGDEIDIVRGSSPSNPEFLTVSRVEIFSSNERGEGLSVKLRRNKALTIDNYELDPHKG